MNLDCPKCRDPIYYVNHTFTEQLDVTNAGLGKGLFQAGNPRNRKDTYEHGCGQKFAVRGSSDGSYVLLPLVTEGE